MRRVYWLMAAILLLVQAAPAIDCSLMGIDGLKVTVSIQGTDKSSYGDSALYASLMKNQLVRDD